MEKERKEGALAFADVIDENIEEAARPAAPRGDDAEIERLFNEMTHVEVEDTPEPAPVEGGAIVLGQGLYLTEEEARAADPPPYREEDPEPLSFLADPYENREEAEEERAPERRKEKGKAKEEERQGDLTAYVFGSYEPDRKSEPSEDETIAKWIEGGTPPDERVDFNLPFEDAPYVNPAMFLALCCRRVCDLAEAKTRKALSGQCEAFSSVVGNAGRSTVLRMTSLEKIGEPSNEDRMRQVAKSDRESQRASKSLVERFVVPDGPAKAWLRKSVDLEQEYASIAKQIEEAQTKAADALETYAKMFEVVGYKERMTAAKQLDVAAFAGIEACASSAGNSESMEVAVLMASAMSYMTRMVGASSVAVKESDAAFASLASKCDTALRTAVKTNCWILNSHAQDLKNEEARLRAEMIKLDERVDASCPSSAACAALASLTSACGGVHSWLGDVASLLERRTQGLATNEQVELLRDLRDVRSSLEASMTTSARLAEAQPASSLESSGASWTSRSAAKRCVDAFAYLSNAYEKARLETRACLLKPLFASVKGREPESKDRIESDREDARELPSKEAAAAKINEIIELRGRLATRRNMLNDEKRRIDGSPSSYEREVYQKEYERMKAEMDDKDKVLARKYVEMAFASKWIEGREGPLRRADLAVTAAKDTMDKCRTAEAAAVEAREAALLFAKRRCTQSTEQKFKIASSTITEARLVANSALEEYARTADRIDQEFTQRNADARTLYYQVMQRVAALNSVGFRSLNELLELYQRLLRKIYEDVSLKRSASVRESCKKTLACVDCVACETDLKKKK